MEDLVYVLKKMISDMDAVLLDAQDFKNRHAEKRGGVENVRS